jgi:hypothetical protein
LTLRRQAAGSLCDIWSGDGQCGKLI